MAREFESHGYHLINQDTLKTKAKCIKKMNELLDSNPESKIVLDNTNSKLAYRSSFTEILNSQKIKYCAVIIDTSKEQCFFLNNFRCKLEKKELLSDVTIHSHFKYREEPKLSEGYKKIIKLPMVAEFNNLDELDLFNQYF